MAAQALLQEQIAEELQQRLQQVVAEQENKIPESGDELDLMEPRNQRISVGSLDEELFFPEPEDEQKPEQKSSFLPIQPEFQVRW